MLLVAQQTSDEDRDSSKLDKEGYCPSQQREQREPPSGQFGEQIGPTVRGLGGVELGDG